MTAKGTRLARRAAERRARWQVRVVFAAGVLVVAAAIATAVLVLLDTDERNSSASAATRSSGPASAYLTRPGLANAFVGSATEDIQAVSSYDYRHLDDALNTGTSVTTGEYQKSYRAALSGSLAEDATTHRVVQTFQPLKAGIGTISADGRTAKVLVFGVERVTSDSTTAGRPDTTLVTLTATMRHVGSRYLISTLQVGASAGLPPGSPELAVAAEAARSEVVNLLSYRRAHFDADYNRALGGAAEPLRSDIAAHADDTRRSVTDGGYDLSGAVTAVGVERATNDTAVLLVAATGSRIDADGAESVVADGRYEVTVIRVGDAWYAGQVAPVRKPS